MSDKKEWEKETLKFTVGNDFYLNVLYDMGLSQFFSPWQRLSGASLLIFANKQDIQGALSPDEIAKVRMLLILP